jgi:hypothetical protein
MVHVLDRSVGSHDGGPHPGGAHVDTRMRPPSQASCLAHGQGAGPKGPRRARACRGSGCRCRVEGLASPPEHVEGRPRAAGRKRERLSPMPWWWLIAAPCGQRGTGHRRPTPAGSSRRPATRRRPSGPLGASAGEREVQAGAVGVGVGLVGRGGQRAVEVLQRVEHRHRRGSGSARPTNRRPRPCRPRCRPATAAPARRRRSGAQPPLDQAVVEAVTAPASVAHSSSTISTGWPPRVRDQLRRARRGTLVSPCSKFRSGLRLVVEAEHRRRGSPAQDPCGRRRGRRRTSGKPKARLPSPAGRGWMRRRASVITPSVPFAPDEQLGQVRAGGRSRDRGPRSGRCGRRPARPRGR